MLDMQRAIRRHHKERMKAKAIKIYPGQPKAIYLADHLAVCSCRGCGNQRQYEGISIQERRRNKEITN